MQEKKIRIEVSCGGFERFLDEVVSYVELRFASLVGMLKNFFSKQRISDVSNILEMHLFATWLQRV